MPENKPEKEMNQKSGTESPTLSLCMIVKNEEHFLPMCLDSVKGYVDEIIIVDTGINRHYRQNCREIQCEDLSSSVGKQLQ